MDLFYIYTGDGPSHVTSHRRARANSIKGAQRVSHRVKGIGVRHKGEAMRGDKLTGLCALVRIGRTIAR